jgi:hypothetical protein
MIFFAILLKVSERYSIVLAENAARRALFIVQSC